MTVDGILTTEAGSSSKGQRWVIPGGFAALVVLALVLRLGLSLISYGSDDAGLWEQFGRNVANHGMLEVYRKTILLNHPPLPVIYAASVWRLSEATGVRFSLLFRFAPIAADVLILWCLWWLTTKRGGDFRVGWAPLAFALDPVSVIVSGFHCNTDSVYVAFVLAACVMLYERRDAWGGLLLGLAVNVKLLPLVLLFPLLLALPVKRVVRMTMGAGITFLPYLVLGWVDGRALKENVLGYSGTDQTWGVMGILPYVSAVAAELYGKSGKWILLEAACAVGVMCRRGVIGDGGEWMERAGIFWLMLACSAVFFSVTPAYAVQYTVLMTPWALLVAPRLGVAWSVLAGGFIACVYGVHLLPGFPVEAKAVGVPYTGWLWVVSAVPWGVAIATMAVAIGMLVRQVRRGKAADGTGRGAL